MKVNSAMNKFSTSTKLNKMLLLRRNGLKRKCSIVFSVNAKHLIQQLNTRQLGVAPYLGIMVSDQHQIKCAFI